MENVNMPLAMAAVVFCVSELVVAGMMRKQGKAGIARILTISAFVLPAVLLAVAFGLVGQ